MYLHTEAKDACVLLKNSVNLNSAIDAVHQPR